jgi:hypothetical protein
MRKRYAPVVSVAVFATTAQALAQPVPAPTGIVSWWPAEGNANDLVGTNNGDLRNGVTFGPGMVGQAFRFDGEDDYIEIPSSPSLQITEALTIECWVNIAESLGPFFPQHYVLDTRDDLLVGGYGLNVDSASIQFFWGNEPWDSFPSTIQPRRWHHVAGTWDGQIVTVYVDGEVTESHTEIRPISVSEAPAYIGQRFTFEERFYGLVDELTIYGRALSADEVRSIFAAGSAGKSPPLPQFIRGDASANGRPNITDAVFTLLFLFAGGTEPPCHKSVDADDDGTLDITDAVFLLNFLFLGGPAPAAPFAGCGPDPTIDELGCDSFAPCE